MPYHHDCTREPVVKRNDFNCSKISLFTVMFSQVSVCPQGGICDCMVGYTPPGTPPPGRHPLGRHPLPSACWDTPPLRIACCGIRSTSWRYASHWNAFLSCQVNCSGPPTLSSIVIDLYSAGNISPKGGTKHDMTCIDYRRRILF